MDPAWDMNAVTAERNWWDDHADQLHVWGIDQPGAWEDGAAACMCAVVEDLAPLSGRVLDLGCGLGRLAIPLGALYPDTQILGVDISAAMLAQAEASRVIAEVGNVAFMLGDGRTIPKVGLFDAAFSVLLFQHLPPEAVARYIHGIGDVLATGGMFCAQYVHAGNDSDFLSWSYRTEELHTYASESGMVPVRSRRGVINPRWSWTTWRKT